MRILSFVLLAVTVVAVSGCSSKFRSYNGPEVTRVLLFKDQRAMHLLHHDKVLKSYKFDLGFAPDGHKVYEGDGRTPEGEYTIDRRNPDSKFHLSIGIDYPNKRDIATATAIGKSPGGDIFIHGQPNAFRARGRDWTAGCIAVTNRQIEHIYAMVRDGTPISIFP